MVNNNASREGGNFFRDLRISALNRNLHSLSTIIEVLQTRKNELLGYEHITPDQHGRLDGLFDGISNAIPDIRGQISRGEILLAESNNALLDRRVQSITSELSEIADQLDEQQANENRPSQ